MTDGLGRRRWPERRPVVYFCTSNVEEKFLQARLILGRRGFDVRHFRTNKEPYAEDYSQGSHNLIELAIREILDSVGRTSLFFVEDTSVRIEALSNEVDYPGLQVKEWFGSMSFDQLDQDLSGQDRAVTVKSDIGLHLPGHGGPVMFHDEVTGKIADSPPEFEANTQYPWLRPDSFNGWFVPDGASEPLGKLSLEVSLPHDFRARALNLLADRLDEYTAAINLPTRSLAVRAPLKESSQQRLFGEDAVFVVVGRLCAGKTTFGTQSLGQGFRHIEASDQLKRLGRPPSATDAAKFKFASDALREHGSDIVARLIVEHFGSELLEPTVITGLRAIEELVLLRDTFPKLKIVHIETNERLRYERCLRRGRSEGMGLEEFRIVDRQQETFGLLPVAPDLSDIQIVNEGSLDEYFEQISFVLGGPSSGKVHAGVNLAHEPRHGPEENQLYRLLSLLQGVGRPITTAEIEEASGESGRSPIRHNNANKVLKRYPALVERVDRPSTSRVRYQIKASGVAYLRMMSQKYG